MKPPPSLHFILQPITPIGEGPQNSLKVMNRLGFDCLSAIRVFSAVSNFSRRKL